MVDAGQPISGKASAWNHDNSLLIVLIKGRPSWAPLFWDHPTETAKSTCAGFALVDCKTIGPLRFLKTEHEVIAQPSVCNTSA